MQAELNEGRERGGREGCRNGGGRRPATRIDAGDPRPFHTAGSLMVGGWRRGPSRPPSPAKLCCSFPLTTPSGGKSKIKGWQAEKELIRGAQRLPAWRERPLVLDGYTRGGREEGRREGWRERRYVFVKQSFAAPHASRPELAQGRFRRQAPLSAS